MKYLHGKSINLNFEKDLEIARLKKEIESLKKNGSDQPIATEIQTNEVQFATFSSIFSSCELKTLRSINGDSKADRPFIRHVLMFLYQEFSMLQLQQKSLFGCKPKSVVTKTGIVKETIEKTPLTPSKVKIIRELYTERITAADVSESEKTLRLKDSHFNQLIATALSNLQRDKKRFQ